MLGVGLGVSGRWLNGAFWQCGPKQTRTGATVAASANASRESAAHRTTPCMGLRAALCISSIRVSFGFDHGADARRAPLGDEAPDRVYRPTLTFHQVVRSSVAESERLELRERKRLRSPIAGSQ